MLRKNKIIYCVILILILGPVCGVYAYYQSATHDAIKSIRCIEMASAEVVKETISDHQDVVLEIEKIGGKVSMAPTFTHPSGCFGAAYVVIYYSTNTQRKEIKKMIGDQFFGHPYRMINM